MFHRYWSRIHKQIIFSKKKPIQNLCDHENREEDDHEIDDTKSPGCYSGQVQDSLEG